MPITGPFYDNTGKSYYYNTDTGQQVASNVPAGTNVGASPLLGATASPAYIPQNIGGGQLSDVAAAYNAAGGLQQQQISNQFTLGQGQLGLSQQQIANQKAQFDAQLAFQKDQMERLGLPQLVIQQRLADLQQQQFQYQMYLTQQQQGLAERGLGLQALQAQAQLGGPSNWVQAYNLAQGLKQTDIPVFMQRLLSGQQTPAAVGGAGLTAPQSLGTLAQQAGAGVPGVTVNGQPVGGTTSIGGQINPMLAPLPFLSTGGGGGTAGGTAGGGTVGASSMPGGSAGTTRQDYAPGPQSPNDTQRGTPIPGMTGMFGGATQNFGAGPGQGSFSLSGQRGTNITGWDPRTGTLTFDMNFLQNKSKVVPQLWDETAGHAVIDSSQIQGANPGDPNGQGWQSAAYVTGGNGSYRMVAPGLNIDPTHTYRIRIALPDEGGGVGSAMEQDVPGSAILSRPNPNAGGAPQAAGMPGTAAPGMPGYKVYNGRLWSTNVNGELVSDAGPAPTAAMAPAGQAGPGGTRIYNGNLWTTNQNGELVDNLGPAPAGGAAAATPGAAPTGPDMGGVYNLGRALFMAGGGALGPQALEGIGPTGLQMLSSVGNAVGADFPTYMSDYQRSRIGQAAAQAG